VYIHRPDPESAMIDSSLPLILVVHEDSGFVNLIREAFIHHGFAAHIEQVPDNRRLLLRLDRVGHCLSGGMVMIAAQMRSRGGLQAIRLATHHRANLPVMLLTLDVNLPDEVMAMNSGALAVMELPVDVDDFRFIIERAKELLALSRRDTEQIDIA
jgi:DNA-binding NtrC family response regulator